MLDRIRIRRILSPTIHVIIVTAKAVYFNNTIVPILYATKKKTTKVNLKRILITSKFVIHIRIVWPSKSQLFI